MSRSITQIRSDVDTARAKVKRISDEIGELHRSVGNSPFTTGQQERWDRLERGINAASEEASRFEGEWRDAIQRGIQGGTITSECGDGTAGHGEHRAAKSGYTGHDEACRTIDAAHRAGTLPDHAAERATALVTTGRQAGQDIAARWAVATGSEAYRSAFAKVCSDPTRGHMLWNGDEQAAFRQVEVVRAAMGLTDANGGFMVPLTLDPAIMLSSDGSINPLRRSVPRRADQHRPVAGRQQRGRHRRVEGRSGAGRRRLPDRG